MSTVVPIDLLGLSMADDRRIKPIVNTPAYNPRDPLHGITLEHILTRLVERYGWEEMAYRIPVRCFEFDPSIKSSLTFLRKTPWARRHVEEWFIDDLRHDHEAGTDAS